MKQALFASGLSPQDINYINLHGTGTQENDLAEGKAILSLFGDSIPPLSSLKGAWGHALAASGTMGAAVVALAIQDGFIPPNTGMETVDPDIKLTPETAFTRKNISYAMINALGFGGNNAVMVMGKAGEERKSRLTNESWESPFFVHGCAMLTGAGNAEETFARLNAGAAIEGVVPADAILAHLPVKAARRLKKLSRLTLSLAISAVSQTQDNNPQAVFLGTRWGSLSETNDFLKNLFRTDEQFVSPTDFIGSVHNSPAGQVAIHFQAQGPNITITSGESTFEQTLFAAGRSSHNAPFLLIGADEYHEGLTPLFDPKASVTDGGGAFLLSREKKDARVYLLPLFEAFALADEEVISALVSCLGGPALIQEKFGLIMLGMPAGTEEQCRKQKEIFFQLTGAHPFVDYRSILGHFGSVSAVAAVVSVLIMGKGVTPQAFSGQDLNHTHGKSILILNLGKHVTALEVSPCENSHAP